MFFPSAKIDPDVGICSPNTKSTNVDFPDPVGPEIKIFSFFLISKLIFFKIFWSFPGYLNETFLKIILLLKSIFSIVFDFIETSLS